MLYYIINDLTAVCHFCCYELVFHGFFFFYLESGLLGHCVWGQIIEFRLTEGCHMLCFKTV